MVVLLLLRLVLRRLVLNGESQMVSLNDAGMLLNRAEDLRRLWLLRLLLLYQQTWLLLQELLLNLLVHLMQILLLGRLLLLDLLIHLERKLKC